jgi:hypothetical protein
MLNIQTQIKTDLNSSKWIRSRIQSENIHTIFIPTCKKIFVSFLSLLAKKPSSFAECRVATEHGGATQLGHMAAPTKRLSMEEPLFNIVLRDRLEGVEPRGLRDGKRIRTKKKRETISKKKKGTRKKRLSILSFFIHTSKLFYQNSFTPPTSYLYPAPPIKRVLCKVLFRLMARCVSSCSAGLLLLCFLCSYIRHEFRFELKIYIDLFSPQNNSNLRTKIEVLWTLNFADPPI